MAKIYKREFIVLNMSNPHSGPVPYCHLYVRPEEINYFYEVEAGSEIVLHSGQIIKTLEKPRQIYSMLIEV